MRRISYWVLCTLSALVLLFGYHTSTQGALTSAGPTQVAITGSADTSSSRSTPSNPPTTPSGSGGSGGGSTGGSGGNSAGSSGSGSGSSSGTSTATRTVTGQVVQTEWGPVQVRLTLRGQSITRVAVLQYPNGNSRDQEINSYALPILIRETLAAQNAQIDMVSGATITSGGYQHSLQSALDEVGL